MRNPGPEDLVQAFLEDAETFRRWGDERQAEVVERCAARIETWWEERELEELSVEEASEVSGYTPAGLRKLRDRGELSDVQGPRGGRRYLRGELPRKPRRVRRLRAMDDGSDLADRTLAARVGGTGR